MLVIKLVNVGYKVGQYNWLYNVGQYNNVGYKVG